MTKANTKRFDCVEVKRRAQQELEKELEGHSPREQYEIIRRLAEELPLWKKLRSAKRKGPVKPARPAVKRKKSA